MACLVGLGEVIAGLIRDGSNGRTEEKQCPVKGENETGQDGMSFFGCDLVCSPTPVLHSLCPETCSPEPPSLHVTRKNWSRTERALERESENGAHEV